VFHTVSLTDRLTGAWAGGGEVSDFSQPIQPSPSTDQAEKRIQSGEGLSFRAGGHFKSNHDNETGIQVSLFPTVKAGYCAVQHCGRRTPPAARRAF
jgi:hypothetical protein